MTDKTVTVRDSPVGQTYTPNELTVLIKTGELKRATSKNLEILIFT